ncbi:hypothetical protein CSUI_009574 [Cystoisospora suis]|uniref:Uncharacterized protein n=1 Tax=Cystoisospora suis TaxID=483139 RepID=A0A2C6KGE5_9APIC|nr:hypothetical protein CSUI_009574 [Cystoisospora suis]
MKRERREEGSSSFSFCEEGKRNMAKCSDIEGGRGKDKTPVGCVSIMQRSLKKNLHQGSLFSEKNGRRKQYSRSVEISKKGGCSGGSLRRRKA